MAPPPAIRTQALRKIYPIPKPSRRTLGGAAGGPGAAPGRAAADDPAPGGRAATDDRSAGRRAADDPPSRAGGSPGQVVALEGLDLEVADGEFFGLLGPNG